MKDYQRTLKVKKTLWGIALGFVVTIAQLKTPYLFDWPIALPWFLWGVWLYYWCLGDGDPVFLLPWVFGFWQDIITMGFLGYHALLYFLVIALMDSYGARAARDQIDGKQMLVAFVLSCLVLCSDAFVMFTMVGDMRVVFLCLECLVAMIGVGIIYCIFVLKMQYFQSNKHFV